MGTEITQSTKQHTNKRKKDDLDQTIKEENKAIRPFREKITAKIGRILQRHNIKPTKSIRSILNNSKEKINLKIKLFRR